VDSLLQDVRAVLTASRDLAGATVLDPARLQMWSAERKVIFTRLNTQDWARAAADSAALEGLILELLDLDGKICARLIESQTRLGEQLTATRKFRRALGPVAIDSPQLLQRLA